MGYVAIVLMPATPPKTPTEAERLDFWTYAYARSSFVEAANYLDLLSTVEQGSATHRALTVALLVAYCRPFKQRKKVRLPDSIVPEDFRSDHEAAEVMRDKIAAHRDLDGPVADWGFSSQLMLHYDAKGFFVHTLSPYAMGELIPKMRALTGKLIEVCDEKITNFVRQFVPKLPPGEYVVSLEEQPKQWLVREN